VAQLHDRYDDDYDDDDCFSTAAMVARTLLNVMLYVQCLSCFTHKCIYTHDDLLLTYLLTYLLHGAESFLRS